MAFRFRRSIKVLPGVRLNLNKKSVSVTAGVPGAHVNIGRRGVTTTLGIPGTGLSWSEIGRVRFPSTLTPKQLVRRSMSQKVLLYEAHTGQIKGPISLYVVLALIADDTWAADSQICDVGTEEWFTIPPDIIEASRSVFEREALVKRLKVLAAILVMLAALAVAWVGSGREFSLRGFAAGADELRARLIQPAPESPEHVIAPSAPAAVAVAAKPSPATPIARPLVAPLRAPSAAEQNAEILRKYGNR